MRFTPTAFAIILLIATVPAPATAAAPYADAGLDQTVAKYTTVHLDASGSTDPDGTITHFRWTLQTPDGTTTRPDCATCSVTSFLPTQVGRYHVTVTVTDDDGETATDTLYVDVEPGAPPTLVLTGPTRLHVGQTATYVAEVTAGDAPIQTTYWSIDGTPITSVSSDDGDVHEVDRQFTVPGAHTVTAELVDADGQRSTRTIDVVVTRPPTPPSKHPTASEPTRSDGSPGARGTASISGPQLLTGTTPLAAHYRLDVTHLDTATWWKDNVRVGTGRTLDTTFTPGDHTLHARVTYTDGTTDVARFTDDTTRVTADPKPTLAVETLTGTGGLQVTAHATDAYENLQHLELALDGTTILDRSNSRFELRKPGAGRRLTLDATPKQVDPGTYQATLTATDARGQTTTLQKRIDVVGPPEVLRAGFVTTSELDVYHPRIAPERYTAKHVTEIKLNGAKPENVEVQQGTRGLLRKVDNRVCTPETTVENDRLQVTTCWSNPKLIKGFLYTEMSWVLKDEVLHAQESSLKPTSSDPEIRVRVISGGAIERAHEWGLLVDARDSFDPDGDNLIYTWLGGAVATNNFGSIGKLESWEDSGLLLRDDDGGSSTLKGLIPAHFNPRIQRIEEASTGPYLPTESVRYVVSTRRYELPKGRYRRYITLGLELHGDGEVIDHYVYEGDFSGDIKDRDYSSYIESRAGNYDRQFWTVEVPAKAFLTSDPAFETFNVYNREETNDRHSFPEPVVLVAGDIRVPEDIVETEYVVERPTYTRQATVYEDRRDVLTADGFEIVDAQETGQEWVFERREQVVPALYGRHVRTFSSSGYRRLFLEMNPEWDAAGSETIIEQRTNRVYEWRSAHGGRGSYTGDSRRIQVQPRRYHVERLYEYDYTTTETRSRTTSKTYKYRKTVEYTTTVEKCNEYVGCYDATVTKEKTVTKTATKDITTYYDVRVERTGQYWSTGKRHYSHSYTGNSRRELIQRAVYDTQYEYVVERTTDVEVTRYLASYLEKVRPAKYEWTHYKTTRSELVADHLTRRSGIRLGATNPVTQWTLRKQTGSVRTTYSTYTNASRVVETHVTISGNISTPYLDPETGAIERIVYSPVNREFTEEELIDKHEAIEIYLNEVKESDKE